MKHYGAFDAKTHFSEILSDVVNGERVVVTRHGVQIAIIIPFKQEETSNDQVKDAINELRKLRKGVTLGKKLSIRKMKEEGRQ